VDVAAGPGKSCQTVKHNELNTHASRSFLPAMHTMMQRHSSVLEMNREVRSPCAYPIASFPPSANCSTLTATLSTCCTLSCREVPDDSSAIEAAAAAGKVVVATGAVPVARADVQGGQHTTRAMTIAKLQVRAWVTTLLAEVATAKI
jgi:hypothetical protein